MSRSERRYEIAKAVMGGFAGRDNPALDNLSDIAKLSIEWAEALIEELDNIEANEARG